MQFGMSVNLRCLVQFREGLTFFFSAYVKSRESVEWQDLEEEKEKECQLEKGGKENMDKDGVREKGREGKERNIKKKLEMKGK